MNNPHIMIVDDDDDILTTLNTALKAEGYETTLAKDGAQALALADEKVPDLALLDIMMPDMDGHEVLRRLKEAPRTKNIAVVFATALKKTEQKVKGLDIGADDYIIKPFNMPELLAKLRAIFRVQGYQRQLEGLVDFAHSVNTIEVHDIVKVIKEKFGKLVLADRYSLFTLDEETGELVIFAHNHIMDEKDDESLLSGCCPIMPEVMKNGKTVFVRDFLSSKYAADVQREKYRDGFAMCIPLKVGPDVFGALNLNGNSKGFFNSIDYSSVELAAEMISASLNNARSLEKARKLAITDGLTKISNHRYFQEILSIEFERATRYNHPLSCMMLDIDYFKNINDTFGHTAGDRALEFMASRFKGHIRKIDSVARYGGEEFAFLLPQTDSKTAMAVAERIRKDMEGAKIETEQGTINVTVSIGVCDTFTKGIDRPQQLVNNADDALYAAKAEGRNKTVIFDRN